MPNCEKAAQALVRYLSIRQAYDVARHRAKTCTSENKDFWFVLSVVLKIKLETTELILKNETPSGDLDLGWLDDGP